jgi:hypothetical protein
MLDSTFLLTYIKGENFAYSRLNWQKGTMMLDETVLENRLSSLEKAVSALQSQAKEKSSENWLEKLIGSISDEEAFLEALEYGRAFRQSDKPHDKESEET